MNYFSPLLSTATGAFIGIISGTIINVLSECYRSYSSRRSFRKNFKKEILFNIKAVERSILAIEQYEISIKANTVDIHANYNSKVNGCYYLYKRAVETGKIFSLLTSDDLDNIDKDYEYLSLNMENISYVINNTVHKAITQNNCSFSDLDISVEQVLANGIKSKMKEIKSELESICKNLS